MGDLLLGVGGFLKCTQKTFALFQTTVALVSGLGSSIMLDDKNVSKLPESECEETWRLSSLKHGEG